MSTRKTTSTPVTQPAAKAKPAARKATKSPAAAVEVPAAAPAVVAPVQAKTVSELRAHLAQDAKQLMGPTHEQIARRAYEIWQAKGRPSGQDVQNWNEALQELTRSR